MNFSPLEAAFAGLAFTAAVALVVWLESLARRDASLIDRFWPLLIAGAGLVYLVLLPNAPLHDPRGLATVSYTHLTLPTILLV